MTMRQVAISIGDLTKIVAPGAEAQYEIVVYPQRAGGTQPGDDALWPVVACYVGAEFVADGVVLYVGDAAPVTAQRGQLIRLRLRNPLDVPATWIGALIGVERKLSVPKPRQFTAAQLERLVSQATSDEPPLLSADAPLSAAVLECVVHGHAWKTYPAVSHRICDRCGAHEDPLTAADIERSIHGHVWRFDDRTGDRICICGAREAMPEKQRCNAYHVAGDPAPDLVPCPRCGELRCPRCRDQRGYCKISDSGFVVCAPPRVRYYCETAPPREVVEVTPCVLDGDALGAVPRNPELCVRGHLRWTARMQIEWERHEDFRLTPRADGAVSAWPPRLLERDVSPPVGVDAFGGAVITDGKEHARCALCGAWLRRVEVRR